MTKNDTASLFTRVHNHGISREEITSSIKSAITRAYKDRYPEKTQDITILFDPETGHIRILSDDKDITPPEFAEEAKQTAHKTLYNLLPHDKPAGETSESNLLRLFMNLIFFSYNGIYLFYLGIFGLGLLSPNVREFISKIFQSRDAYSLFMLLIILAAPIISTAIAIRLHYHRHTNRLAQLFFIFELPTILLSLILFSIFKKPISAVWLFSSLLYILPVTFFLKSAGVKVAKVTTSIPSMLTKELLALSAGYVALLYSFFFPIIISSLIIGTFRVLEDFFSTGINHFDMGNLIGLLIYIPFGVVGLFILTILAFLPYIIMAITVKLFYDEQKKCRNKLGNYHITRIVIGTAFAFIIALLAVSYQPTISVFAKKLQEFQQADTFKGQEEIARDLIMNESRIKQAIKDAQNAHQRYIFVRNDPFISRPYEDIFNMPEKAAENLQDIFSWLAAPFVYRGPSDRRGTLSSAYMELFGRSIYDDEIGKKQEKLVESRTVLLLSRNVSVQTDYDGLLATISVEEEYKNTTFNQQEVIYEFSLPNEATITDLRLGPNLEFSGIIAPRGAAQRVYEQEMRRRRDPALLEQIGPSKYRLRVFPIPGKNNRSTLNGKNQKVKFSYAVGQTANGYPLPEYTSKQNVFTNSKTQETYTINNTRIPSPRNTKFLMDSKESAKKDPCSFVSPVVSYTNPNLTLLPHKGNDFLVQKPICKNGTSALITNLVNHRIAILYDVSYDNHDDTFIKQLQKIASLDKQFFTSNTVDLFKFNHRLSTKIKLMNNTLENPDIVYFGRSALKQAINQLPSQNYDMIVVVAKAENPRYTLDSDFNLTQPTRPVYVVSSKSNPFSYQDSLTTYILQSGGSAVNSFTEAVNHFAISEQLRNGSENTLYVGPYWSIISQSFPLVLSNQQEIKEAISPTPASKPIVPAQTDPLASIAAKGEILSKISGFNGLVENNNSFLDGLNQLAERNNIVTPYSSFIALVNENQKERLEREKQGYNRYEKPRESQFNTSLPESFRMDRFGPGLDFMELNPPSLGSAKSSKTMIPSISGGNMDSYGPPAIFRTTLPPTLLGPIFPLIAISVALISIGGIVLLIVFAKRYLRQRQIK